MYLYVDVKREAICWDAYGGPNQKSPERKKNMMN